MVAPLVILQGAKTGLTAAAKAKEASAAISVDLFKYDFVNLITKLVIFFVFSYIVAKIFEAIIFGQGLVVSFVALFGLKLPQSLPEPIVNFFQEGIKGFRYWDFIKVLAILLVIMELTNWFEQQKKLGIKPSPMTLGVFTVLIGGMTLITFPELIQRVKEIRSMSSNLSTDTDEDGTGNTRTRDFR